MKGLVELEVACSPDRFYQKLHSLAHGFCDGTDVVVEAAFGDFLGVTSRRMYRIKCLRCGSSAGYKEEKEAALADWAGLWEK